MTTELNKKTKKTNHLKSLKTSGTIASASRYTIETILSIINFDKDITVVELGMGDGTITLELLHNMSPNSKLYGFEINPEFAKKSESIEDSRLTVINDSAENLKKNLSNYGQSQVNVVVSTLPVTLLGSDVVDTIFNEINTVLDDDGLFIQALHNPFYYLTLKKYFHIEKTYYEFRNLPPYFVIACKKKQNVS